MIDGLSQLSADELTRIRQKASQAEMDKERASWKPSVSCARKLRLVSGKINALKVVHAVGRAEVVQAREQAYQTYRRVAASGLYARR